MKDYTVLEALKISAAFKIENAFDKGYKQGYNDGYEKGINEVMTIDIFEGIKSAEYNKGYSAGYKDAYEVGKKDGQKAERMLLHEPLKKDLEEAYQKGLQHGQELRVKEAECAEACGMKRAWEAARKVVLPKADGGLSFIEFHEIFDEFGYYSVLEKFSASEVIEKIEAWEKKQDAPDGNIEVGDEVRMIGSDPKLDNCDYGVCTMVKPKTIYVMRMDGSVGEEDKEEWEKTGDHYNIKDILDKMKEHEVEE